MDLSKGYNVTSKYKHCIRCHDYLHIRFLHLHHISYFPEETVYLCEGCHFEVHVYDFSSDWWLKPREGDSYRFYGIAYNNYELFTKRKKMNIVSDVSV